MLRTQGTRELHTTAAVISRSAVVGRRRAWGLRSEEAAHCWLTRLLAARPDEDEQLVFGVGERVAEHAATST